MDAFTLDSSADEGQVYDGWVYRMFAVIETEGAAASSVAATTEAGSWQDYSRSSAGCRRGRQETV
jgi:hypothetical protein